MFKRIRAGVLVALFAGTAVGNALAQNVVMRRDTTSVLVDVGSVNGSGGPHLLPVFGLEVGIRGLVNFGLDYTAAGKGDFLQNYYGQWSGYIEGIPVAFGRRVRIALGIKFLDRLNRGRRSNWGIGQTLYIQAKLSSAFQMSARVGGISARHSDKGGWYQVVTGGVDADFRVSRRFALVGDIAWTHGGLEETTITRGGLVFFFATN